MKTKTITLVLLFMSFFTIAQTIHTVDNSDQSGAMFTDLQAAIDAAAPGDIIQIHPGPTSYGSVTTTKTLTFMGLGHNPANFAEEETARVGTISFRGNSAGSVVKGLTLNGISSGINANSTNLDDIHIVNNYIISAISGSGTANLTDNWIIEGNYFSSNSTNVVASTNSFNWQFRNNFCRGRVSSFNNTSIVTNNIFITASTASNYDFFISCDNTLVNNNIFLATNGVTNVGIGTSIINFSNNLTYNLGGLTFTDLPGNNNLNNTNPMFVNVPTDDALNFYDNDYMLMAGSPAINAGSDGTDIGLSGNNFVFDLNGRPNLTPYPESINIVNTIVAPGQDLTVEFTAAQKQ